MVIIGAGPAGLTCGYEILKRGKKPIVLEENDAFGGISQTAEYKGNHMDLGGHRFFTKSPEVQKIWDEICPDMMTRERVSRILYGGKFYDYPVTLSWKTLSNLGFLKTMQVGFGYIFSKIFKKKEDSLENFYINRFGKPLYECFFRDYTEKLWGRPPSGIDPSWGAQRVKGLSLMGVILDALGFSKKKETSLIDEFKYPPLGPGQLWERMADKLKEGGAEVAKNSKVVKVNTEGNRVVSVETEDGKEYKGEGFFSSMPVRDLVLAMGEYVPQEIHEIAEGLPYRDFITVGLLLSKMKAEKLRDCWIYIQERQVKLGRLQIFNNWSPHLVADKDKMWVGLEYFCAEGDEMWNLSDSEFIDLAIREMAEISLIEKEDVMDACRLKVKKAYPAYFDTYEDFPKLKEFLNGFENLYCIGRNGQHRYNNMDHSMLTAIRAVECAFGEGTKKDIWNVNTEEEYHEEKK